MKVSSFIYLVSALILILIVPERLEPFSETYNFSLSVFCFLLVAVFLIQQRFVDRNWMRLDVVFLIGFLIVHIQVPFLASLGVEPDNYDFIWVNKQVVNYATWMSVSAIAFWMFGYSMLRKKVDYPAIAMGGLRDFYVNLRLYDLVMAVVFFMFVVFVGEGFLRGAYNTASWGGGAAYFYLMLGSMLTLRIFYFFKDVPAGSGFFYLLTSFLKNKIFFFVFLLYCALFALTGSRTEILFILLAVAGSYSIFVRPIRLKSVFVFVVIGAFVFTLMSAGRTHDHTYANDANILHRGYLAIQQQERFGITDELAGSVRILYRALDVVPDKHPYLYGITYVTAITSVFPFLTRVYINSVDLPSQYHGSSNFFTHLGQGAHSTWGEGSEILGDIYINFGVVFVFVIMFLLGCVMAVVTNRALRLNINYYLVYIGLLVAALFINRSHFLMPLSSIAYLFFLHYVFYRRKPG